jgi:small subunit ribosomal protein S16
MPVKIRLQRHGKKGKPFFHIVATDSRSKRDGRYIEKIGTYNPNTNPATIELDLGKAVQWLQNGAEPSDTARAILSYKGALHRHHLNRGVLKGAMTQEQADAKFDVWMKEKESKVQGKRDRLANAAASESSRLLQAEREKAESLLKAREEAEAVALAEESATEESVVEQPATEESNEAESQEPQA